MGFSNWIVMAILGLMIYASFGAGLVSTWRHNVVSALSHFGLTVIFLGLGLAMLGQGLIVSGDGAEFSTVFTPIIVNSVLVVGVVLMVVAGAIDMFNRRKLVSATLSGFFGRRSLPDDPSQMKMSATSNRSMVQDLRNKGRQPRQYQYGPGVADEQPAAGAGFMLRGDIDVTGHYITEDSTDIRRA